ncbi:MULTISPECIES: DUF5133 domain-containing protein [unclassified Streptomyces]|uniref:DUF5133 domain-containing protein n=1 Tax=unclassified Streptomyces TaxID=2593676 RepID=UPI0011CE7D0F|nr:MULTISPECIES: DUF5133 domain-containing protein [unclassified Streptomyces]TXS61152.1 DUF5133 domain-containing protein [Streptomyces sp. me109]
MLLPAKTEVARHLEQYRSWERLLLVAPMDHAVRGNFENAGYTLCVLMGKRCAREAVDAAEHYLRGGRRAPGDSPATPAPVAAPASATTSVTGTRGRRTPGAVTAFPPPERAVRPGAVPETGQ